MLSSMYHDSFVKTGSLVLETVEEAGRVRLGVGVENKEFSEVQVLH
jgi:hypothetical protein